MKFGKIYSDATGRIANDDPIPQQEQKDPSTEDAARFQVKHQWLQSTITKEFINNLIKQFNDCVEESITFATTYPEHQNHHKIIHRLIRANELQKLIKENSQI